MVGALVILMLVLTLLMTPYYSEGRSGITVCSRGNKGRFGRCTSKRIPCIGDAHLDRSCWPTGSSYCCVPKLGHAFKKQPEEKSLEDIDAYP